MNALTDCVTAAVIGIEEKESSDRSACDSPADKDSEQEGKSKLIGGGLAYEDDFSR